MEEHAKLSNASLSNFKGLAYLLKLSQPHHELSPKAYIVRFTRHAFLWPNRVYPHHMFFCEHRRQVMVEHVGPTIVFCVPWSVDMLAVVFALERAPGNKVDGVAS